jgi:hypothetical protein
MSKNATLQLMGEIMSRMCERRDIDLGHGSSGFKTGPAKSHPIWAFSKLEHAILAGANFETRHDATYSRRKGLSETERLGYFYSILAVLYIQLKGAKTMMTPAS